MHQEVAWGISITITNECIFLALKHIGTELYLYQMPSSLEHLSVMYEPNTKMYMLNLNCIHCNFDFFFWTF